MKLRDLIFVGMDMTDAPLRILSDKEEEICKNMTDNERDAYWFGINTFASLLESLLTPEENEVFIHIPNLTDQEEFDLDDLLGHIK